MKKITGKPNKRQKIITAAIYLFSHTHDVKRVSLEDIAEKAEVSPATIYNNFGDRDTLLFEIIKEIASRTLERNRAIVHSSLPFPQKLIGIIGSKMDIADQVSGELIEKLVAQDKKIAPFIDQLYHQEIKPLWLEIIADGKKQGYIDSSVDDNALVTYLDVIQAGYQAKPEFFKNFGSNLNLIKQITNMMFYGFLKKEINFFEDKGNK
jgi:AcrR family transcriptional regulator